MIKCHMCPDHRLVDEKDVAYYLWNGGQHSKDENRFLSIGPSVTKEPVPGSVPVCPDCLKNLMKE